MTENNEEREQISSFKLSERDQYHKISGKRLSYAVNCIKNDIIIQKTGYGKVRKIVNDIVSLFNENLPEVMESITLAQLPSPTKTDYPDLWDIWGNQRWRSGDEPYSINLKVNSNVHIYFDVNVAWELDALHSICNAIGIDTKTITFIVLPDSAKPYNGPTGKLKENTTYNFLISGVPGSGKSHFVDDKLKTAILGNGNKNRIIRTVFHPEYTNSDFIGQLKPATDENGAPTYEFFPGPFTKALCLAYGNDKTPENRPVMLVIEELNRGDCAAIFGEVFQLLDRKETGWSTYGITAPAITEYMKTKNIRIYTDNEEDSSEETETNPNGDDDNAFPLLKIPPNLYLIATMNTSDQNVFPLDTAFNRRWDFVRYPNELSEILKEEYKSLHIPGHNITWINFMTKVNEIIKNSDSIQNREDKQLGVFFVKKEMLIKDDVKPEKECLANVESGKLLSYLENPRCAFANKVIGYLWNEVVRNRPTILFREDIKTLDDAINKFIAGENPFKDIMLDENPVSTQKTDPDKSQTTKTEDNGVRN